MISKPYVIFTCDGPECEANAEVPAHDSPSDKTLVRRANTWLLGVDGCVYCSVKCKNRHEDDLS